MQIMQLGIDNFFANSIQRKPLHGRRIALLGHPASMTSDGRHSLDALMACQELNIVAAFGPQHGMRGDKQDNMIESADYVDPRHSIPVFSLYGKARRPTPEMMDAFDVLLVDLQDIGTRIYTFVTTLIYMLEACAQFGKSLWVLDRPNPAGRPIEGTILEAGWESFVGAAPIIMRHGMTLGELAVWYVDQKKLDVDVRVIPMPGYIPDSAPGYGWPLGKLPWVNPSPNAGSVNMARCFPGTVLFEGTTLSEGRGTTTALEMIGAPDLDFARLLKRMALMQPDWLQGCLLRPCWFEPTFHKHAGKLCAGVQIHAEGKQYDHRRFKPYRLAALLLKAVRLEYPDYALWRDFPYEYETERLAIDLLAGGTFLREWVDDERAGVGELEEKLLKDEREWDDLRGTYLIY